MGEILSIGKINRQCSICQKLSRHEIFEILKGDIIITYYVCYECGHERKEERDATK